MSLFLENMFTYIDIIILSTAQFENKDFHSTQLTPVNSDVGYLSSHLAFKVQTKSILQQYTGLTPLS